MRKRKAKREAGKRNGKEDANRFFTWRWSAMAKKSEMESTLQRRVRGELRYVAEERGGKTGVGNKRERWELREGSSSDEEGSSFVQENTSEKG